MSLEVRDLTISLGQRVLVDRLSFTVADGERFGIIGESGSGKSLTTLAVLGLLPDGITATGSIRLDGLEIIGMPERELARIRGRRVGAVFQDPQTALNPMRRIGDQLVEPLLLHGLVSRRDRPGRVRQAVRLAELVRLPEPELIVERYPHQLSGGQRQRVGIGIAVAASPQLLLADEPTTALDVTIQAEILALFNALVADAGASLIFVTHDLAVLSDVADTLLVLAGGVAVERGSVAELISNPRHPVTAGLVAAARRTSFTAEDVR
ncbi:ABC transporter ATP-binding protein [Gryllotalpicola protaetiae]|uniref:ABC transporter ATP-binding protein n=1 Tax=Gryllotalpicola protaetiae TaxID=2419771 RepID=A0A387BQN1_9MICO|nr:ABC transporter ATP-binding protein [Gryllotalpicola protaetiae]AYG04384.1 ABC transporter ATP-binding protein [Gryllotalpicola protaetiae]